MSNSSVDGRDLATAGWRARSLRAWLILLVSALAFPAAAALGGLALALFSRGEAALGGGAVAGILVLAFALLLAWRIASGILQPVAALAALTSTTTGSGSGGWTGAGAPAEIADADRAWRRLAAQQADGQRALRASDALLRQVLDMAAEAIIAVDDKAQVLLFSPAAEKLFGCSAAAALGADLGRFLRIDGYDSGRALLDCLMHASDAATEGKGVVEVGGLRQGGEAFQAQASIREFGQGGERRFLMTVEDIAARKRDEARLNALANFDPLTALPNRALFHQRLQRSLVHAQRFNEGLAVLVIDLDRFKNVNDTLGHEAGDRVLQAVAERLKGCLREVDTLARLGGDEFAVLVEQVADTRMVGAVARKLLKAVSEVLMLGEQEYHITTSIGISTYPADGADGTTLLKNADTAMYRAKEKGKNNSQFYAAAMNANSLQRLTLETGMRHALERGEFLLHYQPKVDIATGRITGMEALVRWKRPDGAMVSPAEFIPLAEETGLIVPIGAWVLRAACERDRAWQQMGMPPLRVAVNLSARQFAQANLVSEVAQVLDASGLAPSSLELEITESMVMDNPERAIHTLWQLKSMGIALAIDDFGTGYSSLGYLKRFPIDNIKIDRSFIKDIPANNDDATITRTIIAMTHNLRLKAVAEGVENEAQLEFLRRHGCDEMQGYYFSRPLAEDAFLALVQAQEAKAKAALAA